MNIMAEPGSFRDPGGRVFDVDGRIFRTVMPESVHAYECARDTGLLERLVRSGMIVGLTEADPASLGEHGVSSR